MSDTNLVKFQQGTAFPFPLDNVSPKLKEKDPFGLEIARAIWGYASVYDTHLFYNDRDKYIRYKEYALGMQPEDKYKPLLNEDNKGPDNKKWLRAINFRIKNYATKRINIVISKMHAKDYDIVVEMTDPVSKGLQENIRKSLEIKMKNRELFEKMKRVFGNKVDLSQIPNSADEIQMIMDNDFKMIEAAHLEKAIPYHLERNRFDDTRRLIDFDLTCLGVGAVYIGMDENLRPYIDHWNPADIITPYNDKPSFDHLPYIAGIKWVTIAEFRKMAIGYLADTKIQETIDLFGRRQHEANEYANKFDVRRYDDVTKIALLQYNYRSTDSRVFLEKDDEFGNSQQFEKSLDYYSRPKEMDRFNQKFGNSRKIHRVSINAVYEGFWVIGSDVVFRHGRRSYSTEEFGVFSNTGMGFKIYAPNAWDGMVTSMSAQMIPNLDELQRYNLKIQQLVARAIPKGIGIDLYALRKANLQWGGKGMTDQEKIEMFLKSGIFVFSSKDRYAAGSNYRPFYEVENGLADDIEKYLRLTQNALMELDEIIGMNKATAASTLREDAGKGITELQVGATEVALDHLYSADHKIYKEIVQDIGVLHIKSYNYSKRNRQLYSAMFGQGSIGQDVTRFDLFQFGYNIEARPTNEEWQDIYNKAEKAYDKGIITFSDTLFLREFKSIKQARLWLMMKERQALRAASEKNKQDIALNGQTQQQSLEAKGRIDAELEDRKLNNAISLEEEKRKTIQFEANVALNKEKHLRLLDGEVDRRGTAQEGKIKDRHIDAEGDIDITIAAMRGSAGSPGKEKDKKPVKNKKES